MSLEECRKAAGMEQAEADANIQYAISLLHPSLVKLILSNPITKKKMGKKKKDFSQSLQAIIEDWNLFYPAESKFAAYQKYFSRAKQVRHLVAHQSFDRTRYQHEIECLSMVATAIGQPNLKDIILNLVTVKDDHKENKEKKNQVNINSILKKEEWISLKEEGNQFYKEERWNEALNCYSRAIQLNQQEAALYSNRALCELRLSKLELAREDIEDAIQLDPKNVKYFRVLSEVLLEMKLNEESLSACLQGLKIDPRDEVLNLRERDCRALIAWNPLIVKSASKATKEEMIEKTEEMMSRYKSLPLTSEDIEDCPNLDKLMKIVKISNSVYEANKLQHGLMPFSTKKGQEKKALDILKAAAKKGSAEALVSMALLHSEGKAGLPRDFHKAMELYRKAASQKAFFRFEDTIMPNAGVDQAECFLGDCYRDGRGVDRNATEAFKFYLKSAWHDNQNAQNNLGIALLKGYGCKKNETSARSWFQKAAEQGHPLAQYHYALVLEEGLGGPIDTTKAAELLQLSADQGTPGALERLQKLSMSGALGGSNMKRTKENLEKAGEKGDPSSLFLLARNYLDGTGGFVKDLHQAERYFREASKTGFAAAHLPLGKLLLELKKNEEAFEFIKLSAEKGSGKGQCELGILFAYGHGCARDEDKARRWMNRAKEPGTILKLEGRFVEDWVAKEIDCGREISEFETQQQLKTEGTSLEERKRRFISSKLNKSDAATSTLEYLRSFSLDAPAPPSIVQTVKGFTPECVNELLSRAKNGSATARSLFIAGKILKLAIDHLAHQQTTEAFKLFRFSLRQWNVPITKYVDFYSDCVEAAMKALDRNSKDADALYVFARLDTAQSVEEKLQMAKRCVELDPAVPDFHHYLACMWSYVADSSNNGLRAIDRAIELLPSHLDWLYDRASFLRVKEKDKGKYSVDVEEAYLKFVSSNPTDHRDYPKACYYLAQIYLLSNEYSKGKMYFQKGLDAENPSIRLPCFEPIDFDHPLKAMTRKWLKDLEKEGDPAAASPKETPNNCANCLEINKSFRCTICKSVWYCDRDCQVAHWKKHKVDCKPVERS